MYYHTLANQPVMQNFRKKSTPRLGHFSYDAHRVWLWFPMFSFFESKIDGKIPNEFEWPIDFGEIRATLDNVVVNVRNFVDEVVVKMSPVKHETKDEDVSDIHVHKRLVDRFQVWPDIRGLVSSLVSLARVQHNSVCSR